MLDAQTEWKTLEEKWYASGVVDQLYVLFDEQTIELDVLIIHAAKRGQGYGTNLLSEFTALADKYNLVAFVTPLTQYGASSLERLTNFYCRFGFLSNETNSYPEYYGYGMVRFPVKSPVD